MSSWNRRLAGLACLLIPALSASAAALRFESRLKGVATALVVGRGQVVKASLVSSLAHGSDEEPSGARRESGVRVELPLDSDQEERVLIPGGQVVRVYPDTSAASSWGTERVATLYLLPLAPAGARPEGVGEPAGQGYRIRLSFPADGSRPTAELTAAAPEADLPFTVAPGADVDGEPTLLIQPVAPQGCGCVIL